MTNLLTPRYIVIAETPFDNSPSLNTILTLEESGVSNWLTVKHNGFVYSEMMLDKYTGLFRKLFWWEFRDESEMPEYVKVLSDGIITKVINWDYHIFWVCTDADDLGDYMQDELEPATLEQYTDFKSQNK